MTPLVLTLLALSLLQLTPASPSHVAPARPLGALAGLPEAARAGTEPGTARPEDGVHVRLVVTDGRTLLAGAQLRAGDQASLTNALGGAALSLAPGARVELALADTQGAVATGWLTVPWTSGSTVDALLVVDFSNGLLAITAAGDAAEERHALALAAARLQELLTARASLEAPGPGQRSGRDGAPGVPPAAGPPWPAPPPRLPLDLPTLLNVGSPVRTASFSDGGPVLDRATDAAGVRALQALDRLRLVEGGLLMEGALPELASLRERGFLGEQESAGLAAELARQGLPLPQGFAAYLGPNLGGGTQRPAARRGQWPPSGPIGFPGYPGRPSPPRPLLDVFEPDGTPVTCRPIATDGTAQSHDIDPAADLDHVCFDLACGDSVTIQTTPIPPATFGGADTFLELYDPTGALIAANDNANNPHALITTVADLSGQHVVRIRGNSPTSTGTYSVSVFATQGTCLPADASEPNDSAAACAAIATDGSLTAHRLRPLADQDWFCFDVPACGTAAVIDVNEPGDPAVSARVLLLSPSGAVLLDTTSLVAQSRMLSEPGTHQIRVTGSAAPGLDPLFDNSAEANTGDYTLALALTAPTGPCDAFEPDASRDQCNVLAQGGSTLTGHSLSPAGDEDWYCFELDCNDTITLSVTPQPLGDPASLRLRVELWGPTGPTPFLSVNAVGNGDVATLTRAANPAGHWYARVLRAGSGGGSVQVGDYDISALRTSVPDPACDDAEPDGSADACQDPPDFAVGLVTKSLFPARDEDFICLGTLVCGHSVIVETSTPPGSPETNTTIDLFRLPDTTTPVLTNLDGGAGLHARAVLALTSPLQDGTYVAAVRGALVSTTGPYDVAVSASAGTCPAPDPFEPDGTPATCNPLVPGGPDVTGHGVFPIGDLDFYCVELACGDNLWITVTPLGPVLRPVIQITHPTAGILTTIAGTTPGAPVTASVTDDDAGTYLVQVSGGASTTGDYLLTATASAGTCLVDLFEPDDTPATCRFASTPLTESRAINPVTDSDYTCLNLDCGSAVIATVTPTSGTLLAILRLDTAAGLNLATAVASAPGAPVTLFAGTPTAGLFNLEVDSSSGTTGAYDISITTVFGYACSGDAFEPDGTADACQPIATDGSIQAHTLLPHPDEDWVCFDVQGCGSRIVVATIRPEVLIDPVDMRMELYSPSGVLVAANQAAGAGLGYEHLLHVLGQGDELGTYRARMVPRRTGATFQDGGQYELFVMVDDGRKELIVPQVAQTPVAGGTQLEAQALVTDADYSLTPGSEAPLDILGTGRRLWADGLSAHVLPLGFDFPFYDSRYPFAVVQSNGLVTFSHVAWIPGIANDCIPDASSPNEYISAFWEDFQQGMPDGELYVETIGAPGSRTFIAHFENCPVEPGLVTMQIQLHEGSGDITFLYGEMSGASADGGSATVGLENSGASRFTESSCNTASVFTGTSLHFTRLPDFSGYPEVPGCQTAPVLPRFEWFDVLSGDSLAEGAVYVHPTGAACQVRLEVSVSDPGSCCPLSASQLVALGDGLPPVATGLLVPLAPQPPSSAQSACNPTSARVFQVSCAATDDCDPAPRLSARLLVTHHVPLPDGSCDELVEAVDVDCDAAVRLRLVAPPCAARPPASALQVVTFDAAGGTLVSGERIVLEVTATDSAGNSGLPAIFDPTTEPSPLPGDALPDGTPCPALAAPAAPRCPGSMPCGS